MLNVKVHLNASELVNKLKADGMMLHSLPVGVTPEEIITELNYYRVINGFRKPFLDKINCGSFYVDGVTLSSILSLYHFDIRISHLFYFYIIHIEDRFKAALSEVFSRRSVYGYTDMGNFHRGRNTGSFRFFRNSIRKCVRKQNCKGNRIIRHFLRRGNKIPIWALLRVLPLGITSQMLKHLRKDDAKDIVKLLDVASLTILEKAIWSISILKNCITHNDRIYDIQFFDSRLGNSCILDSLEIPFETINGQTEYLKGTQDLFSVLIIFRFFLHDDLFFRLMSSLKELMKELEDGVNCPECYKEILNAMGFPDNWFDLKSIDRKSITK